MALIDNERVTETVVWGTIVMVSAQEIADIKQTIDVTPLSIYTVVITKLRVP